MRVFGSRLIFLAAAAAAACAPATVYLPDPPISASTRYSAQIVMENGCSGLRVIRVTQSAGSSAAEASTVDWGVKPLSDVLVKDLAHSGIFKSVSLRRSAQSDIRIKATMLCERNSAHGAAVGVFTGVDLEAAKNQIPLFEKNYEYVPAARTSRRPLNALMDNIRDDLLSALAGADTAPSADSSMNDEK